jgi:hypothetical protein
MRILPSGYLPQLSSSSSLLRRMLFLLKRLASLVQNILFTRQHIQGRIRISQFGLQKYQGYISPLCLRAKFAQQFLLGERASLLLLDVERTILEPASCTQILSSMSARRSWRRLLRIENIMVVTSDLCMLACYRLLTGALTCRLTP